MLARLVSTFSSRSLLRIVGAFALISTTGCDDKTADASEAQAASGAEAQPGSVAAGAEPNTAAGKLVKQGKENIEVVEEKMEERNDAIVEQTVEVGTVERGMP